MKIRLNQKELAKLSAKDRRKAERWARTHGFTWQLNKKLAVDRRERFGLPVKMGQPIDKEAQRLMRNARKLERQEARR